jgi:hypothetical protein
MMLLSEAERDRRVYISRAPGSRPWFPTMKPADGDVPVSPAGSRAAAASRGVTLASTPWDTTATEL